MSDNSPQVYFSYKWGGEGERIVVTGNFLLDAESNLRSALSGFEPAEARQ